MCVCAFAWCDGWRWKGCVAPARLASPSAQPAGRLLTRPLNLLNTPLAPTHPLHRRPQIIELIEGGGKYATEADVEPAADIINPLRPVDYHNDYGVDAVIETESVRRDDVRGGGVSQRLRGGRRDRDGVGARRGGGRGR